LYTFYPNRYVYYGESRRKPRALARGGCQGEPDIQFHINSGRTWESKTTYKFDEDGNKTESHTINTMPCPTVDVYDMVDSLEVIIHIPIGNPIIIDWFTVDDEYESFLSWFVDELEDVYEGIEVTAFAVDDDSESLGEMVRSAIESNTPSSVKVPLSQKV